MDYQKLENKIKNLNEKYKIKVIGESVFKRKIYAVERVLDKNFPTAIFLAGIHGREHITSSLVFKMIEEDLFEEVKDFNLSFILMANPDGVELSAKGIFSAPKANRGNLLKINGPADFSMWKANGRGVDLNNNFDAEFGTNVHKNVPSSSGFPGEKAESEPETKAIVSYTRKLKPFITLSYHSKGEEIYYNFFQDKDRLERDKIIAEHFANSTGYVIKNPELTSSGGYKDFCVEKLKIPALTIEVGSDRLNHPIGDEFLDEIFKKHNSIAKDLIFAYNVFEEYKCTKKNL